MIQLLHKMSVQLVICLQPLVEGRPGRVGDVRHQLGLPGVLLQVSAGWRLEEGFISISFSGE